MGILAVLLIVIVVGYIIMLLDISFYYARGFHF